MDTVQAVFAWASEHPESVVQIVLMLWAVANVVWAQLPKPKTQKAQWAWKFIHTIFGLVSTHATAKGTFTWPSLLRAVMTGMFKKGGPDPFVDADGDGKPDSPVKPKR